MPGESSQEQHSGTKQAPWAPTVGMFTNKFLPAIREQFGNYHVRPYEQDALQQLRQNANNLPNLGSQAAQATQGMLSGDPSGQMKGYFDALNQVMNADLDPMKTPGIKNLLDTIRGDVSNNVNSMFAGAGRDLSGMHTQALGRGIAQGEAQPLLNQYNQNVANRTGAAGGILAGNESVGNNQVKGFGLASMLPDVTNMAPNAQLAAWAKQRGLPLQNLAQLESLMLPIAGLGGQSQTNSYSQSNPSVMSQIMAPMMMMNSMFGKGGMFGF
jgi:hypothetical protein